MSPEPLTVFERSDTSVVSDALDEHGIDGVVAGLEPAGAEHTAVGRARPVAFERAGDEEPTNFPFAMLEAVEAGEVFVLAGVGDDVSSWGGQASALADSAGMAGAVVDGGYRDVREIREGSFPVFGRDVTPKSGQGRVRVASTDAPVSVDGVRVAVGDVVVADATGVVVVPADREAAVAETVEHLLSEEDALAAKVSEGADIAAIREAHDRF